MIQWKPVDRQPRKLIRWIIGIAAGVLVGPLDRRLSLSRAPLLQRRHSSRRSTSSSTPTSNCESFEVKTFPMLAHPRRRPEAAAEETEESRPLHRGPHFEVSGGLLGMLHRQRRFRSVELDGPPHHDSAQDAQRRGSRREGRIDGGRGPGADRSRRGQGRAAHHRAEGSAEGAEGLRDPPSRARLGRLQPDDAVHGDADQSRSRKARSRRRGRSGRGSRAIPAPRR